MSLTLFGNSGKAAVIELEKEIEPSATKASLVEVECVFEVKAKAAVEVLVNGNVVATVLPGEPATASKESVTFEVAAGQKYEVKKATGLKEALASVALEQQSIVASDIATLEQESRASAEAASIKVNQELAEHNARLASAKSE